MKTDQNTKIKIGSKYANEYSYDPVVGCQGVVMPSKGRLLRVVVDEGRETVLARVWYVHSDDCLPLDVEQE